MKIAAGVGGHIYFHRSSLWHEHLALSKLDLDLRRDLPKGQMVVWNRQKLCSPIIKQSPKNGLINNNLHAVSFRSLFSMFLFHLLRVFVQLMTLMLWNIKRYMVLLLLMMMMIFLHFLSFWIQYKVVRQEIVWKYFNVWPGSCFSRVQSIFLNCIAIL